jgi:DNA helicase II / ATP-dependent DNA helicase PcrA
MTRAKEHLYMTWTASRRLFGHSRWNAPSRFIEEAGIETGRTRRPVITTPPASVGYADAPAPEAPHHSDEVVEETNWMAFSVGMRVKHAEFGFGKIIEKSGTGDSLKVVVLFDSGAWKKLLVKYAGLERG